MERVVERRGEFLSPNKGYRPLYCVYVQVTDGAKTESECGFQILVLDFYSPEIYGKAGDRIQFRYVGKLPHTRKLDFDSLIGYFIISTRSQPIPGPGARLRHISGDARSAPSLARINSTLAIDEGAHHDKQ